MSRVVKIPPRPAPEVVWELPPPCGACAECLAQAEVSRAVTFINAHFGATVEKIDPQVPGYLRAVDRLMAERDREVEKLRSAARPCSRQFILVPVELP